MKIAIIEEGFIRPPCCRCGSKKNVGVNEDYDCAECRDCVLKFIDEVSAAPDRDTGINEIILDTPLYIKWKEVYTRGCTVDAYDIHEWKSFDCDHLDEMFFSQDMWD